MLLKKTHPQNALNIGLIWIDNSKILAIIYVPHPVSANVIATRFCIIKNKELHLKKVIKISMILEGILGYSMPN